MISSKEYTDILERYGIEVRHGTHGTHGMIEDVMVCFIQSTDGYVILWDDIGYDEEGEFTNFANSCECYADKDKFIEGIEKLMMKYKTLKIQEKLNKIEKDFG